LNTQSHDALASGLLEGLKISVAAEKDLEFLQLCSNFTDIKLAELDFKQIIAFCLGAKKHFVEIDEFDRGVRRLLNFGHTFGHAVEKHSKYSLRHGECVAIGMAYMAHLQSHLGLISDEVRDLHFSVLAGLNLPLTYTAGDWPELKSLMSMDKKSRGNTLRFVTISEIGKTDRIADVAQADLVSAYEKVCS
jgi:3-dehydroquinate synthase